ncbi:MAG: CRISPR-associated endonuclease Cas1 [Candidatus Hinthialibacter antarcticus]|nr:CRISPR-associated endonuclease Cas1 [Candidatus Hinthialibacter antarcticus]
MVQSFDPSGAIETPEFIPARMLNEFSFCPRLCYLEWVEQEWRENEWTLDGTRQHRRVDKPGGALPDADKMDDPESETIHARSVTLSAPGAGFIAKLDLIEADDGEALPVEYKRGAVPDNEDQSWEPDRVQLAAQALVLRENGYRCSSGVIYYAQSRRRVTVPIDASLIERTNELARELRQTTERGAIPPPLVDSPKCPGCSLVGICLPDETNYALGLEPAAAEEETVRRLYPARDDASPLYAQEQGAYVGKSGEEVTVKKHGAVVAKIRLMELSHVCLFGSVQISTQAVQQLMKREIPVLYFSYGGWFNGLCSGMPHKNIELRRQQYRASETETALKIAQTLVRDKIQNTRTLLRRNSSVDVDAAMTELKQMEDRSLTANAFDSLLGIEGNAGRIYFQHFATMIKNKEGSAETPPFDFQSRNRRPPRDPVNALLSLAYSMLAKDLTLTLLTVGFDPYLGFYHQPRYGRPALALDLMEPFRPLIADSTVLTSINTGVVAPNDFIKAGDAVSLKPDARKRFIMAYERRMDALITHPVFNYRVSYRRVLEIQARLLARFLTGELQAPPTFTTR